MRVVKRSSLVQYGDSHADTKGHLLAWFDTVNRAQWDTPQDIKVEFATASFLEDNRVCFNIKGNDYRLIVQVQYQAKIVWIKFIGTHAEYDKIDANTVDQF